jgi:hypothetical protein
LQFFDERLDVGRFRTVLWKWLQHANASNPLDLLRPSHERRRHCAANKRYEFAPPHCGPEA